MQCHRMLLAGSQKLSSVELSDTWEIVKKALPVSKLSGKRDKSKMKGLKGGGTRNTGHTPSAMPDVSLCL